MGLIWELDFYSRPILDENGKKLWEVLICETPLGINTQADTLFRYTAECPGNQVNSIWLKQTLQSAISEGGQKPEKIRFFRRSMANMITKACNELDLPVAPSRRTYALHQWLKERTAQVYPAHPGFDATPTPAIQYGTDTPQSLPDALLGQKWTFASLEIEAFQEMSEWDIGFGESFGLSMFNLDPGTLIPGVIIYSSRAMPLAGWMSGLELAFLTINPNKVPQLLLETDLSNRWILANLNSKALDEEGQNFEAQKLQAAGIHFLAVQSNPKSESFAGFWLLQELREEGSRV